MQVEPTYQYNRVMKSLSKSLDALNDMDLDRDYDTVPDENPPSEAQRAPSFREQIYINYSRQQTQQDSRANNENQKEFPRYAVPLARNKSGEGSKKKEAADMMYDDVEAKSKNALCVLWRSSAPVSRTWMWSSLLLALLLLVTTVLMFLFAFRMLQ